MPESPARSFSRRLTRRRFIPILVLVGATLRLAASPPGVDDDETVDVYSSISPAYRRTILADGKRQPETYAFGEGGDLGGAIKDATIDRLGFLDIARRIAPSLAKEAYLPCDPQKPDQAKLLIMVYWGTTVGTDGASSSAQYQIAKSLNPPPRAAMSPAPSGPGNNATMTFDPSSSSRMVEGQVLAAIKSADDSAQIQSQMLVEMANRQRDKQDVENAGILGFRDELKRVGDNNSLAFARRRQDVIDEVEESRYYVVLLAYDFQLVREKKQRMLLWETRFSIPQRRNDFSQQLAAMAASAARYYGQDSQGLAHRSLREGHVDLGELKVIGTEPDRK